MPIATPSAWRLAYDPSAPNPHPHRYDRLLVGRHVRPDFPVLDPHASDLALPRRVVLRHACRGDMSRGDSSEFLGLRRMYQ